MAFIGLPFGSPEQKACSSLFPPDALSVLLQQLTHMYQDHLKYYSLQHVPLVWF